MLNFLEEIRTNYDFAIRIEEEVLKLGPEYVKMQRLVFVSRFQADIAQSGVGMSVPTIASSPRTLLTDDQMPRTQCALTETERIDRRLTPKGLWTSRRRNTLILRHY